jgi:ABC-type phosphate transport system substrate-binding protein
MTRFKTALFLATASGALIASAAQAQTNIAAPASNDGEAVLHGAGATSIQNVLVQELNCIGGNNPLGLIAGTTTVIAEPTNLPITSGGTFNCSTQQLEPNFSAKYVASGSGFGKTAWSTASGSNPFTGTNVNPFGTWTSIQYAFSDSNVSSTELTNYTNNVSGTAGPAVFFPMYVLPVAVAYNPTYGTNTSNAAMNFNVVSPKTILGVAAGGLQLNASTYCKIFNGYITNWNDAEITADNGGTPLFDTTNDTSARWTSEGAPIRLVGRVDRSGTTDLFSRHLATICSRSGVLASGQTNKFAQNAETLPYSRGVAGTPDFTSVRSDTGLSASSSATTAGTINSVSNTYFISTASGFGSVAGGTSATPVVVGGQVNGSGLFLVANGSGGVTNAINYAPDYVAPSGVKLNGKIGYIGSDFVAPAPNATLFSAALKGSAGASANAADYKMPSAVEGTFAVANSALPPQTNGFGGFSASDTSRGLRNNPQAWTSALYAGTSTLAAPATGYPITGTTQFAGYSCYKAGNADAIRNFIGWTVLTITTDSTGTSRAGIFSANGATTAASGLLVRSNIGVMPSTWRNAINQSFLSGSDGLGLQIRSVAARGGCSGQNRP